MSKPLISVVFCAFNEGACVIPLMQELQTVAASEPNYDFEFVGVENGSLDDTFEKLSALAQQDSRLTVVQLSRNFRLDGGLSAGLDHVRGDACVLMAADLQDPPRLIHEFLRHWEQGYENIYGLVRERPGVPWLRRFNSRLFYRVASTLSSGTLPIGASDFRLVDRRVYESVRKMRERNRFVRGLFAWAGFKSVGVPFDREERFAGESQAHSMKVLDLAVKGILAHSFVPLRLITLVGTSVFAVSLLSLPLLAILWVTRGVPFAGYGTIVALLSLGFGAIALMIGLVAEYVALVYEEVKQRPLYLVRNVVNKRE